MTRIILESISQSAIHTNFFWTFPVLSSKKKKKISSKVLNFTAHGGWIYDY